MTEKTFRIFDLNHRVISVRRNSFKYTQLEQSPAEATLVDHPFGVVP